MVRELMHDPLFLGIRAAEATEDDLAVARDLLDTLVFYRETCVGMAANMIGVAKKIIAVHCDGENIVMLNPELIKASEPYQTKEGCLSLLGDPRPCKRYRSVKVKWQTTAFEWRIKTFTGFSAEIIQHEIDHLNGILI